MSATVQPQRFAVAHPSLVTLLFILVSLVAQLGCLGLWKLSQFGQTPFPELPIPVILFFGAFFVAPLLGLYARLEPPRRTLTIGGALLLNLAVSPLLSSFTPIGYWYVLAPLTAVGLTLLYPPVFGKRSSLAAAMTVYIVCTILANYTFDSFLPLPVYGLVNVGTLFFGVTFTQRDRVHRYGRRWAYLMIGLAALLNVITALGLGTPLRYVAVGFAAILLSETADTEVYQRFINRSWWTRVARSNAVSIPIDTVVFTVFAFVGESFATPQWMLEVIVTDILLKLAVGFVAAVRVGWQERRERVLTS